MLVAVGITCRSGGWGAQEGCGSSPGRGWSQRLQGRLEAGSGGLFPLWAQVPLQDAASLQLHLEEARS